MVYVGFRATNNFFILSLFGVFSSSSAAAYFAVVGAKFPMVIGSVELAGEYGWYYWSDTINYILLVVVIS